VFPKLEGFARPVIFRTGWPQPVSASEGVIRAILFEGLANKKGVIDALVVNRNEEFLQLESFDGAVRVTSGKFTGDRSIIAAVAVRIDDLGKPIPPKRGIRSFLSGKDSSYCSWQEALAVTLCFTDLGPMPPGLTWWRGTTV
jgi:hypothetical protein